MLESELTSLNQPHLLPPDELRERAESLRRRATACADLASDCLTEDAKLVLIAMAEELGQKAGEFEKALLQVRATAGDSSEPAGRTSIQG